MYRAVVVAFVVLVAGCSLPALPSPENESSESWSETEFVVAVDAEDNESRYVSAVENATDYWETNAETYLGHPVAFQVDPNASSPDLRVRVVDRIEDCGIEDHAAGCAPVASDLRRVSKPVSVRIRSGFDDRSTRLVTRHEFGHVLGLGHDDNPQTVMQSSRILASLPQRNATERPVPWDDPDIGVYLDVRNVSAEDRTAVREQVDQAMVYYNTGADGTVSENVTFRPVASRDDADIVVNFPDPLPCGEPPGSCSRISGFDPDRDGARERYEQAEIYLAGLSTDAVGWHVGRWFGSTLGIDDPAELPAPFRNASFDERRSEWWR